MMLNNPILNRISTKNWQYNSIVLIMFFVLSLPAYAAITDHLKKVGEGNMSWMFLDIYRATFFTENGVYQAFDYPQALSITYLKDINKNRLLEATKKQWLLQDYDQLQIESWIDELSQIWPNIKSNDNLIFYVDKNNQGIFYYNQRLIGSVSDKELSTAFLAIWLSHKTSQPKLRRQLLGI